MFVALKTGLSLFILLLVLAVLHVAVRTDADETSRFLRNTLPYLHNMTNAADERRAWSAGSFVTLSPTIVFCNFIAIGESVAPVNTPEHIRLHFDESVKNPLCDKRILFYTFLPLSNVCISFFF